MADFMAEVEWIQDKPEIFRYAEKENDGTSHKALEPAWRGSCQSNKGQSE